MSGWDDTVRSTVREDDVEYCEGCIPDEKSDVVDERNERAVASDREPDEGVDGDEGWVGHGGRGEARSGSDVLER